MHIHIHLKQLRLCVFYLAKEGDVVVGLREPALLRRDDRALGVR